MHHKVLGLVWMSSMVLFALGCGGGEGAGETGSKTTENETCAVGAFDSTADSMAPIGPDNPVFQPGAHNCSCYGIMTCNIMCDDPECGQACMEGGSTTAQSTWKALKDCIKDECPVEIEAGKGGECSDAVIEQPGAACWWALSDCLNNYQTEMNR